MFGFDPSDPFPRFPEPSPEWPDVYRAAQKHSAQVDAWLGLEIAETEERISRSRPYRDPRDEQAWVGLAPETLLTPYSEFRQLLEQLRPSPHETVVDLGAAYGRLGFVLHRHWPGVRFVGIELVEERVEEGRRALKRFGAVHADLKQGDLRDGIPEGESFFLYDFGSRLAIEEVLQAMRLRARRGPIRVVARGRASRDAIERDHPWLSQVIPPVHSAHFSIYRSGEAH